MYLKQLSYLIVVVVVVVVVVAVVVVVVGLHQSLETMDLHSGWCLVWW